MCWSGLKEAAAVIFGIIVDESINISNELENRSRASRVKRPNQPTLAERAGERQHLNARARFHFTSTAHFYAQRTVLLADSIIVMPSRGDCRWAE